MIAICPNPYRDSQLSLTKQVADIICQEGETAVVCPIYTDTITDDIPENMKVCSLADVASKCSLVIVIGGDGTVLSVAKVIHSYAIPVLGINLGTKGFMASIEKEDIHLISQVIHKDYRCSRRMMLDVELLRAGSVLFKGTALNDAVIHGYGDCIYQIAKCNQDRIASFNGDGLIIASPTGSTGYSMSAGGPIVEPDTNNIIVTPICPHAMGSRSFVLDSSRTVSVETKLAHARKAYLSLDGVNVSDVENGDILSVKKSEDFILMILGSKSFFDSAYEKLI